MARSTPVSPPSPLDLSTTGLIQVDKLINAGRLPEAAALLNDLQARIEGDPRIYMMGTRLGDAAGRPDAALMSARKAVQVAPQWAPAALDLALCLARQNLFTEAAAEAERAAALAPGHLPTIAGVIEIAHRAGYAALALKYLPRAIELAAPDNAAFRRMMAQDLISVGRAGEAIEVFDTLLAADPADEVSLRGRAMAAQGAGDRERAVADWAALAARHPDDEALRYQLSVARGETPETQPASIPRALFDELAPIFDHHAVRDLKYRLPQVVAGWIVEKYPDRNLNLLDLGCGTGLLGACLGPVEGSLIGVELSEKMIEQAHRHQVYARFHRVDLVEALRDTLPDQYDVVAALDVFVYTGELSEVIRNAWKVTRPGGYFVFSCERAGEDEAKLVLRETNRYAHRQSHIETLCRDAGFDALDVQDIMLRLENAQPIDGYWIAARKATTA